MMFDFDSWGDWAQERTAALVSHGIAAVFKDGRQISELASNPSYLVEVSTSNRAGYIGFWKVGLCDIDVINTSTKEHVENASMLDANDETVPALFERFVEACGCKPDTTGS